MITHCYEQSKGKIEAQLAWKGKQKRGFEPRGIGFEWLCSQKHLAKFQQGQQVKGTNKPKVTLEGNHRELPQCWGCGWHHRLKYFPHRKGYPKSLHNVEGATKIEDMARATLKIYVALEDLQANNQSVVVQVKGKIAKKSIYIMIDWGSTHSYVTPKIVKVVLLRKGIIINLS